MECRCGCGESVRGKRKFVNKEHQIEWMLAGGASQIGALQPPEARSRGGTVAGNRPENKMRLDQLRPYANERARQMEASARAKFNEQHQS